LCDEVDEDYGISVEWGLGWNSAWENTWLYKILPFVRSHLVLRALFELQMKRDKKGKRSLGDDKVDGALMKSCSFQIHKGRGRNKIMSEKSVHAHHTGNGRVILDDRLLRWRWWLLRLLRLQHTGKSYIILKA
jgi:hypothetical protein